VVSESFDSDSLAYDVTVNVKLKDLSYIEAIITEHRVGDSSTRRERFTSSGQKTVGDIGALAEIRFKGSQEATLPPVRHLVGTDHVVSLEPQERFRNLSFSTLPSSTEETFDRRYEWSYRGQPMWFEVSIPKSLYEYCTARPRVDSYGFYGGDTLNDAYVKNIAEQFSSQSNLSKSEQVDLAISFVQSLEYTSDSVTAGYDEYQRYPAETLVDRGGDCEDTAILLGSILKHMGFGVRGVLLPGHMALAVKGEDSIPGTYYTQNGDRYYYVETTGDGWRVGDIPDEYKGKQAKLVKLTGYPCLNFEFRTMEVEQAENMFLYQVHNSGDAPAEDIRFDIEFVNENGQIVTGKRYQKSNLAPGEGRRETVLAPLPEKDIPVKVRTSVYLGGELHARHVTPVL
jgi:predicted transglutaminase-like cysteine proteinase